MGDYNSWLGNEEDGQGAGREGFGRSNTAGKRMSQFLKETGLVCVEGRVGGPAPPTRSRISAGKAQVTKDDYIAVSPELLNTDESPYVEESNTRAGDAP
jgi:hypothetical protein